MFWDETKTWKKIHCAPSEKHAILFLPFLIQQFLGLHSVDFFGDELLRMKRIWKFPLIIFHYYTLFWTLGSSFESKVLTKRWCITTEMNGSSAKERATRIWKRKRTENCKNEEYIYFEKVYFSSFFPISTHFSK